MRVRNGQAFESHCGSPAGNYLNDIASITLYLLGSTDIPVKLMAIYHYSHTVFSTSRKSIARSLTKGKGIVGVRFYPA